MFKGNPPRKLPVHRTTHYNLFWVTEDHRKVRRLRISVRQLRFLLIFLVLGAVLFLSSAAGFWYYRSLHLSFEKERRANLAFALERNEFLAKLKSLEAVVQSAEGYANKLASLVGTERPVLQKGIGPVEPHSFDIRGSTEAATWDYLRNKTDDLKVQAKGVDLRIQELVRLQENKIHYLASLPSIWPVRGWVTSEFGYRRAPYSGKNRQFHRGIDVGSQWGSSIVASAAGVVRYAGHRGTMGKAVMIDHGYGIRSVYAHASAVLVRQGQVVERGTPIARVGSSGHATGPHLHYEITVDGVAVDPMQFVAQFAVEEESAAPVIASQ